MHTCRPAYPAVRQRLAAQLLGRPWHTGGSGPWAGATPQSEGLVRVRTQVCFHTPAPVPWGRSRSINPYAGRRFERRFEAAGHPFADRPAVWQSGITEQSRGTPDGSGHSPSRQVRDAPVHGRKFRIGVAAPAAVVQPQGGQ